MTGDIGSSVSDSFVVSSENLEPAASDFQPELGPIVLRQVSNLLEVSWDGGPLPQEVLEIIDGELSYFFMRYLYGRDAYDPITGSYQPVCEERRSLYQILPGGTVACFSGYRERLERTFRSLGFAVRFFDERPAIEELAPDRADRYRFDPSYALRYSSLLPHQIEVLRLFGPYENGLFELPTGTGKTYLLSAICLAFRKARIHVISEGIPILRRIVAALTRFLPNVGYVGEGKADFQRVTVISSDSLHRVAEGFHDIHSERAADIVLFDEVHRAATPSVLSYLARYENCRLYGFSASVDKRPDNAWQELEGIFGPIRYRMPYQRAVDLRLVVPIRVQWIPMVFSMPFRSFRQQSVKDRYYIWANGERNRRIASYVRSRFSDDVQVLIMVSTIEHALSLKALLPEYEVCYGAVLPDPAVLKRLRRRGILDQVYIGEMTPERRDALLQRFASGVIKKVIATDVWSTGVDFPNLQVLVRADGRASPVLDIQVPGRVSRLGSGKEYGLIVDCWDDFHYTYRRRSQERWKSYVDQGWEVDNPVRSSRPR